MTELRYFLLNSVAFCPTLSREGLAGIYKCFFGDVLGEGQEAVGLFSQLRIRARKNKKSYTNQHRSLALTASIEVIPKC